MERKYVEWAKQEGVGGTKACVVDGDGGCAAGRRAESLFAAFNLRQLALFPLFFLPYGTLGSSPSPLVAKDI